LPIPKRVIAVLAFFPAMAIHGQERQVSGPLAGYVFDGAALRPIAGLPGGAMLGDAIDLGLTASAAVISPQLDSVMVAASDGSLHLFRLSGKIATEVSWNSMPHVPARVVYSPSGTAAAIYASGRVQVVSGLPNSPAPAFSDEIGPSPTEPGREPRSAAPKALAVSDDATFLVIASGSSDRLLSASGSSSVLMLGVCGVPEFVPGGHDVADLVGALPELAVFPDGSATPSQRISAFGLSQPVGLSFSADGKLALAASRTGKSVTIFDLAAGGATTLRCDCTPTGVSRMGSLFRLTDAGSGPVWMVDAAASPPRIVFVPARTNP
jgi:hypothetical protein